MTDVRLTRQVALGGAMFSLVPGYDQDHAADVIRAAADAGVRVFESPAPTRRSGTRRTTRCCSAARWPVATTS